MGPPSALPDLRACRVLRLVPAPARPRARPCHRPPHRAVLRAGRGLAVVLRRRGLRLSNRLEGGLDEQPEHGEDAFPFFGVNGLDLPVDGFERPGQRDADAAEDQREPGLRLIVQHHVQRRSGGQGLQDAPELNLLVEAPELVHALLQPLGDGEVPGIDDVTDVRLRGGLGDDQQVVDHLVDEVEVVLHVVAVDADLGGGPEEPLALRESHHRHGRLLSSPAPPIAMAWACRTRSSASRIAMAPSPTAAATRLAEPLRTSPTANMPGWLVSRAERCQPVPAADGASWPVRMKPWSSRSTRSPSQPVQGDTPMKTNSARALSVRCAPLWRSSTVTASRTRSPSNSRISVPSMTSTFAIRWTRSMRYRDMFSDRSASRTARVTREACRERKTAAWPAELPPPTITTGSPRQISASAWEAA